MKYPSVGDLLVLHDYVILKYGGEKGILNPSLLESAVYRPRANIGGKDLYPSLLEKAAVLMYSLIKNHPFVDGNKRTGVYTALTFLGVNGVTLKIPQQTLADFGKGVAKGTYSKKDIQSFLEEHLYTF